MGGMPDSWDSPDHFVMVPIDAIAQIGAVDAVILARIAWRCRRHTEGWTANLATIAAETGVPERTAKRATQRLREAGFIESRRAASYDARLTWSVIRESDIVADFYDLPAGSYRRRSDHEITVAKNGGGAHLDLMTANYILSVAGG